MAGDLALPLIDLVSTDLDSTAKSIRKVRKP